MRNNMYAWYLDNRFYITKSFVDEFIDVVFEIKQSGKEVDGSTIKAFFPSDGNASSRITFARNVGIIDSNGRLSDSAMLYKLGLFDYSEFILEIISKRNTTRNESINLKPVVLLSVVFSKMAKLNIKESERFITIGECYEYLSPLETYDELTDDLVSRLVDERVYDIGSSIPKSRVKIESGAVYLSSLFYCLNDTPIFRFGGKKTVLRYDPKHINFINYLADNGAGMSPAPLMGGSSRQNADYYSYLCDIRKGLFEIFPKLEVYKSIPHTLIKTLYDHCFGLSEAPADSLKEYVSDIPFGCFAPFITLDRLVAAYFYLHNERLGELMFDYISQVIDKEKATEEDMIRIPFSDTNHTLFDNIEDANSHADEPSGALRNIIADTAEQDAHTLTDRAPRVNKRHPLNSILYGAPGTGKTYSTAEYALAIIEDREIDRTQKSSEERAELMSRYKALVKSGQIVFTTFHQSYGYEDFIQGLRPDPSAEKLEFKPLDGVFKRIADKAMDDEENDYVIIIDEINRANISRVFGELITLIEDDKRWGEVNAVSVTLPSGEPFAVPNNLYIIGTMNSADKSISLIDTALRRRFKFIEVVPDYSTIDDPVLKTVLERLNNGLVGALESTDLLIGHAYFIGKTQADLCDIMNNSIIPLLYEYFYDNTKKVKEQIKNAVEGYDFDIADNKVGRIRLIKKD